MFGMRIVAGKLLLCAGTLTGPWWPWERFKLHKYQNAVSVLKVTQVGRIWGSRICCGAVQHGQPGTVREAGLGVLASPAISRFLPDLVAERGAAILSAPSEKQRQRDHRFLAAWILTPAPELSSQLPFSVADCREFALLPTAQKGVVCFAPQQHRQMLACVRCIFKGSLWSYWAWVYFIEQRL